MSFSSDVIAFLNSLAAKDQRVTSKDPYFQFHGAELHANQLDNTTTGAEHQTSTHRDQGLGVQDETEAYSHMPADTDTDTKDGDTTANKEITAAYEQVLMPPPLSPPRAEAPLEGETYQDLPICADDEEPCSELHLEETYPPQGDATQEITPRPRRPPETQSLPSPIPSEDLPSTPETPEDSPTRHHYPTRTRSAPNRMNLTAMSDKMALLSAMYITAKRAMREDPIQTEPAIIKELQNLTDKTVLRGVHLHQLTPDQRKRILRSQMNVNKKVTPSNDGTGRTLDKVKARLVAGGNGQDRNHYSRSETSSPTASTSGLAITLMLAAATDCHCVTADIGCAYLNAAMPKEDPGKLVFIRISPHFASMLVKVDPKMHPLLCTDG